jgi:hypothetical protein
LTAVPEPRDWTASLGRDWQQIPWSEMAVLRLVYGSRLSYEQAAEVLFKTTAEVAKLASQGLRTFGRLLSSAPQLLPAVIDTAGVVQGTERAVVRSLAI